MMSNSKKPDLTQLELLRFFNLEDKDVESLEVYHDEKGVHLGVTLEAKEQTCPVCMAKTRKIHSYYTKKITHSLFNHVPCYIDYHARRFKCPRCRKTFYENNPFVLPESRVSALTVFNVLDDLKNPNETFTGAAKRHHISPTTAQAIFDRHVRISRRKLPRIICIDEVYAYHSRITDYVCVLLDYESQNIIDLLPSRRKKDLINYLSLIPREERLNVELVSFDMWKTYRSVSKLMFPNAKTAVDKFHVYQELQRRVDRIRCDVMNRYMKQKNILKKKKKTEELTLKELNELNEADVNYYVLKKFNWLLFKNDSKLTDANMIKRYNSKLRGYYNYYDLLQKMVDTDPILAEAVNLKDELDVFYKKNTYETAEKELSELIADFSRSTIPEMVQFANTLRTWRHEIVNSFIIVKTKTYQKKDETITRDVRINNAIIENRNKAIKCIKHNSNGYLNWQRFRNRVLYALNDDATFFLNPPLQDKQRFIKPIQDESDKPDDKSDDNDDDQKLNDLNKSDK